MTKTLWGGRFHKSSDPAAFSLNASIAFDNRMALQDVRGSVAWAKALLRAGVIPQDECDQIITGLDQVRNEFGNEGFLFVPSDEDIHTAVERRLAELIGPTAGKLHTGRSRNDQVSTDFRLWLMDHIPLVHSQIQDLQKALIFRAEADLGTIISGYTHLQQAQPILLSHWWLGFFWPLERDKERLEGVSRRTSELPLGCGALAGTAFPIDRNELARMLEFKSPAKNSLDAVSDRDFAAEFLFFASLLGIHMSKLAEGMILYTTKEFGFIQLDDAFTTGSSLMPQKKNPDHFELARGKAGTLIGSLTGLLTTLKGLPSAYDKDLQEDKLPVFNAVDTLLALMPVITGALRTLTVNATKARENIDPAVLATDLADYLVRKGVPFREAHHLVGQAVKLAEETNQPIAGLSLTDFQNISPIFSKDVFAVFDLDTSIAQRSSLGGTALTAVKSQLSEAKKVLSGGIVT